MKALAKAILLDVLDCHPHIHILQSTINKCKIWTCIMIIINSPLFCFVLIVQKRVQQRSDLLN